MITKYNELKASQAEGAQGGPGTVEMTRLATKYQMYEEVRLFNKIKLVPGSGIGEHFHTGECELIYVISGNPTYNDNGNIVTLEPGDVTYCPEGDIHWIRNDTDKDVEIIALIVVEKK